MLRFSARTPLTLAVGLLLLTRPTLHAQGTPLGTFRWQLQPFCNVVTVTVIQQGAVYTVDGYDDQCGAPQRAPLVGLATPNPDGSIGLGLHVVTVPGGRGLHIDARISLANLSGPWTDSAGNSGTFAFGASAGGSPRPPPTVPASAIAAGAITAAHLAPGVIGAVAQARVSGVCANGQALRGVNPDGTVVCTDALTPVDDPANQVGAYTSIAIGVDGFPIISYLDGTANALRVTHCGNAACTAGNVSTTVDDPVNGDSVGSSTSLAIGADGLPVISHWGVTTGTLRVTHCGNVDCTAGIVSTTVDDPAVNNVGRYTSIAIGADGLPVISHQDTTANALRVTHCGNPACTAGNTSVTVDDPAVNSVGYNTSIAIGADGLPVISHQDGTAGVLRVTHCGNAACTAGNSSTTADNAAGDAGSFSSIAIGVDGLPVISHQLADFGALRVTHCGNVACTAGNVSTTVDGPDRFVGTFSAIAIGADGLPVISHMDETAGGLRVMHCGNPACTAGNVSLTVDDPVNTVGFFSSIAIGTDGLPVISHHDFSAGSLRVAKCGTRTCQ